MPEYTGIMSTPLRFAFDIGGVISKYPERFRRFIGILSMTSHAKVFIITDMHDREYVWKLLVDNGFEFKLSEQDVYCADYAKHGEGCKAVLLKELAIDFFFDDFIGYVAIPGGAVRLLVMPDPYRPYYDPNWLCDSPDFGRRVYSVREAMK